MHRILLPTLRLSLEMTDTLARIERNGLRINLDTLDEIEKLYQDEFDALELRLNDMAREAMGDTPVSLTSPDDRSMLLYSRKVKDKRSRDNVVLDASNYGEEMRRADMARALEEQLNLQLLELARRFGRQRL